MPASEHRTHGTAIGSEAKGERFDAFTILTKNDGVITLLARRSSKPERRTAIDLFDEGEFIYECKAGSGSRFLKDASILKSRRSLAKRYPAFAAASRFANTLRANPAHEENQERIYSLLHRGLDAWEAGRPSDATYFKCLYLYCRAEGYPLKEDWARRLAESDYSLAAQILNHPLETLSQCPDLTSLVDNLEQYIATRTHIRLG